MANHRDITSKPIVETALDVANAAWDAATSQTTGNMGSVAVPNGDGSSTWMGDIAGISGIAQWVGDTTPPGRPTGLSATSENGAVTVNWDGSLEGGIPADFAHITITATDNKGGVYELGELAGAGSQAVGGLTAGLVLSISAIAYDDAHDRSGQPAPNASGVSDLVKVTVRSTVRAEDIERVQKAAQDAVKQAGAAATVAQSAADSALTASTNAANATATAGQAQAAAVDAAKLADQAGQTSTAAAKAAQDAKQTADNASTMATTASGKADSATQLANSAQATANMAATNASEKILNGGFETGDLTSWKVTGKAVIVKGATDTNGTKPHSGNYHVRLEGAASISQTMEVRSGRVLKISGWVSSYTDGRTVTMTVSWGTSTETTKVCELVNGSGDDKWHFLANNNVVVPDYATTMTLTISANTSYNRLDDITVRDITESSQAQSTATQAQATATSANQAAASAQTAANQALANAVESIADPMFTNGFKSYAGNGTWKHGKAVNHQSVNATVAYTDINPTAAKDCSIWPTPYVRISTGQTWQLSCWVQFTGKPANVNSVFSLQVSYRYGTGTWQYTTLASLHQKDSVGGWQQLTGNITFNGTNASEACLYLNTRRMPGDTSQCQVAAVSMRDVTVAAAAQKVADQAQATADSAQKTAANAAANANRAQAAAQGAQTTADSKNKVFMTAAEPSHTGLVPGDLWFKVGQSLWPNPKMTPSGRKIEHATATNTKLGSTDSYVINLPSRDHIGESATAFPVRAGEKYTVTADVLHTKGSLNLSFGLWYYGQTSGAAWDTYGGVDSNVAANIPGATGANWRHCTKTVTVPAGKTSAAVYFQINQAASGGADTWQAANITVYKDGIVSDGNVVGIQVWNGAKFVDYDIVANQLLVPSSVGTTQIADNAVTTGKIVANAIKALHIDMQSLAADTAKVGALTAAIVKSGKFVSADGRTGFDSSGFWIKDSSGAIIFRADASGVTTVGKMMTGKDGQTRWQFENTKTSDSGQADPITAGRMGYFANTGSTPAASITAVTRGATTSVDIQALGNSEATNADLRLQAGGAQTLPYIALHAPKGQVDIEASVVKINGLDASYSVIENLTLTKKVGAADTLDASGVVFVNGPTTGVAVISLAWVNNGQFQTASWGAVALAEMQGWQATREAFGVLMENVDFNQLGKNGINGGTGSSVISYRTPGVFTVQAKAWHKGSLIIPVKRV